MFFHRISRKAGWQCSLHESTCISLRLEVYGGTPADTKAKLSQKTMGGHLKNTRRAISSCWARFCQIPCGVASFGFPSRLWSPWNPASASASTLWQGGEREAGPRRESLLTGWVRTRAWAWTAGASLPEHRYWSKPLEYWSCGAARRPESYLNTRE